jgi:Methyltransferase domain
MRSSHGMPPYDRSLELRDQIGLEPFGLVTNEIWHDDPRQLGVLLARYKFVAQMLADRQDVGELGCADAFGTRIVLQATKKVTVYDANPVFIEDVRRRYREEWPLQTAVHDILSGPLPTRHDSIYSLNALEHVYPEQEDVFARNLRDSLAHDHDVLIVGGASHCRPTPIADGAGRGSATSADAPNGQIGASVARGYSTDTQMRRMVFPRSGAELKTLLERYFHTVFLFSMSDEIIRAGADPMSQYVFALCCSKKT